MEPSALEIAKGPDRLGAFILGDVVGLVSAAAAPRNGDLDFPSWSRPLLIVIFDVLRDNYYTIVFNYG